MVKVRALKENVKRDIFHIHGGFGFNEEGIADWPDDQFTKRRIRDGDVEYVEVKAEEGRGEQRDAQQHERRRRVERTPESQ